MSEMPASSSSIDEDDFITEPPKKLKPRSIRDLLIGGIGFLVFFTAVIIGMNMIGTDNLRQLIVDAGPLAPIIYIVLKAVTYVFAPLTSGPIQVMAGTLFGNVWLGVLYTLIGEVLGGSISFWLARSFGRPLVARLVGAEGMQQVEQFYQNRLGGWISLAVARIVLFSVWDFLSYAAGLAESVRFRSYFLVSVIFGALPTFFFVWTGTAALQDSRALVMIYVIVAIFILIPIVLRKQIESLLAWAANIDKTPERDED